MTQRQRSKRGAVVAIALLLIIVVLVMVVLLDRDSAKQDRAAAYAASSTTGFTSPYDLTELPTDIDLDTIREAAFLSISLPSETGELTSYGVSADVPAAQDLIDALMSAQELDADNVHSLGASSGSSPESSNNGAVAPSLVFVLPTRETVTFAVDLQQGLATRGSKAWRPDRDLKTLVDAATVRPR
ncbi:MAG: hypothetical protein GXY46_08805 [Actinobacteria bacterium]|nr:hypothetical protein [Actinomycetota bacterium]